MKNAFTYLLTMGLCFLLLKTSPIASQETEEENKPSASEEKKSVPKEKKAEETEKSSTETTLNAVKKELLSVKEQPKLKLQLGPGIGKPLSVLPRPFLPKGSVKLPAKSLSENHPSIQENSLPRADKIDQTLVETQEKTPLVEGQPVNKADDIVENTGGQNPLGVSILESGSLAALDPSGVAVNETILSPVGADFWTGLSRAEILTQYSKLTRSGGSSALDKLSRDIYKAGIDLPAPKDEQQDVNGFLRQRFQFLSQSGEGEALASLLALLPADKDWSEFDEEKTKVALAADKRAEACAIAEGRVGSSREAYWLRLLTFCNAINGRRDNVDFQISVLEELDSLSPAFFKLIDYILIEAETGVAADRSPDILSPLNIQILEASLVNISRAAVSDLSLENVDPLAVPVLLKAPGVKPEAKVKLLEKALIENWVTSQAFTDFIIRFAPTPIQVADAYSLAQTLEGEEVDIEDPGFIIDLTLASQALRADTIEERMTALQFAYRRAVKAGHMHRLAGGYLPLVRDVPVTTDAAQYAEMMIRMGLVSGDYDLALNWFTMIRQSEAGKVPNLDTTLIKVFPYMALLDSSISLDDKVSSQWWDAVKADPMKYEKAGMIATVLEAQQIEVAESFWEKLAEGPVVLKSGAASPAQWRALLKASLEEDRRGVFNAAHSMIASAKISNIPVALSGTLLASLVAADYKEISRSLAIEMLVLSGL
ncbi:hypothetical protein QGN29_06150 [Temperatibacter marinus]|uniref:Uncharacterized protein n=1 Tax=Temperatibacter marinus TaxID=1456591 RepID=A0AA52HAH0_9PROT|nr:hypothetical protein [Temperatibacter marinus]WND03954.1 hypothetical protein QGN29_06150 [Temperatibacter marinus]